MHCPLSISLTQITYYPRISWKKWRRCDLVQTCETAWKEYTGKRSKGRLFWKYSIRWPKSRSYPCSLTKRNRAKSRKHTVYFRKRWTTTSRQFSQSPRRNRCTANPSGRQSSHHHVPATRLRAEFFKDILVSSIFSCEIIKYGFDCWASGYFHAGMNNVLCDFWINKMNREIVPCFFQLLVTCPVIQSGPVIL